MDTAKKDIRMIARIALWLAGITATAAPFAA
jgi:hypothetical protein